MRKHVIIVILLLMSMMNTGFGQGWPPSKRDLLEAIRQGADYACNVLLDEDCKSRCDYNVMKGTWSPYEAAWHTGQIINALLDVYKLTKEERYLALAKKAGDWWLSLEMKDRPQFKGMVLAIHGEDTTKRNVFSTISDGTPGLYKLYRVTGEKKYADLPTSAGEWMLRHMYLPKEGMFYDMLDYGTGEVLKRGIGRRAAKERALLSDVARPNNEGFLFKDMYKYTKKEEYRQVFVNLCETLLSRQGPEGLWMQFQPNDSAKGSFHPRFNLWYAESLIEGYELTGDRRYLDAARKTVLCYAKYQSNDGLFRYKTYLDGRSKEDSFAGSAASFMGLLGIRLCQLGAGDGLKEPIDRSARWVLKNRFSSNHPDKNLAGAFLDLNTQLKDGTISMTQRDVGTSFALRFLTAYFAFTFK